MTKEEVDQLFAENIAQLNILSISAGSMIKGLLRGIETNGPAYIRLKNPVAGGNKIEYSHVEGDATLVARVGKSLGLKVTDTTLETRNA